MKRETVDIMCLLIYSNESIQHSIAILDLPHPNEPEYDWASGLELNYQFIGNTIEGWRTLWENMPEMPRAFL